jgi:hypothetical protein
MSLPSPCAVPLAIRVYPEPLSEKPGGSRKGWHRPESMLVFDTETTTDPSQRLLFGCYRFIDQGECREEGLFYADDLSTEQLEILQAYVRDHKADTAEESRIVLLSKREFLKKFFKAAYKVRCLVVGFNLPFDLSRLAVDVSPARRNFGGGFSLGLWTYVDKAGNERVDPNRPRITIKHIDSKRSLISFTGRKEADQADLIPEGSIDGKPEDGYRFRGHFLDLKTLAFALTDRGHSLKSACEAFGVERGKTEASEHGVISEEYIHYNRRDVEATALLAEKLFQEYDLHPISLPETKALSPASIGKAYLREMGITPISQRQENLQPYIGYAQTAFFGGRTSAHIRKVPVPVVYTDFLSMYPTVNSLMDLWQLVIASHVRIVEHCQDEIIGFLEQLTTDQLFLPETWRRLKAFVRVAPEGDILPTRGRYSATSNDWQVAINHLYSDDAQDALWFSLPDVVASVILTGRIPKIIDAFRIEPSDGILDNLSPIKLRGRIEIDPREKDFFKTVIEERKRVSSRTDLSSAEKERLGKALKVLANSASYGIYGQMDRRETDKATLVKCHGIDPLPYTCRVTNVEKAGEFCFPPLASLITGGARLMLALLEKCVAELGGTYAMEDTDSMAIVSTKRGGPVPCPGGPVMQRDGSPAVKALTWTQVADIAKQFEKLNPYDRGAVPGSILKIEDDNFDPHTREQRQIWCLAISAKRYALFLKDKPGNPVLLKKGIHGNSVDDHWSEHGLGHLLNPIDLKSEDRAWIAQVWQTIICESLTIPAENLKFERIPAVGRVTITSQALLNPLAAFNEGKRFYGQIKPFNFLLTCHVSPLGHPVGADPSKFHLIAPFETNPKKWLQMNWIDQYSGKVFKTTTDNNVNSRATARVKTYGDTFEEYAHHPESKCADELGNVCDRQTTGLLYRRHVRIGEIIPIGKESNKLEEVGSGLIHSAENIYTEYPDQTRDCWEKIIRPKLRGIPISILVQKTGLSRRMLIKARHGHARPHPRNQKMIMDAMRKLESRV